MTVFEKIIQLLDENGVKYQVLEHERVHTCEEAARIQGTNPDQGAKALVCIGDKKPMLIVLPCSKRLKMKNFKKKVGIKDLRLASVEEVRELTGLEPGAIPPFGKVVGLPTHVDAELLEQKEICFNAGLHEKSVLMSPKDYVRVMKPKVGRYVRELG
jgi:Ala-tRNA(Pro) deacylase